MRARAGLALFAALAFTLIIALLLAGAVAASTFVQRSSQLVGTGAVLDQAADYAITTVLMDPDGYALADLPLGQRASFVVPAPGSVSASVSATRLPGSVVWLVADVSIDGAQGGHRRFNVVARFPLAGTPPPAAIVSRGDVRIGHDVVFLGDTSTDAECRVQPPLDVVVAPGARVTGRAANGDSVRASVRAVAGDSAMYRLTSRQLMTLDSAIRIVHVRGDTTITGGTFEGILVAEGSITITGPFRATGILIARGRIIALGGSGEFGLVGGMMAFAPQGASPSIDVAEATVSYAPCVVARAFRWALGPRQVPKRGWAEIF